MTTSARERMAAAAFDLFDEQGYDATTVEQVVDRAGVSRSTFFRAFGSKEDVIFPRHDELQARMAARLATGSATTLRLAVTEAARLVLEQYVAEGPLALSRYRLTRSVPALRQREVAGMLGYQRLFREHLRDWLTGTGADPDLRAELLAAAIVTGHNVVLRRWLRGETDRPFAAFDEAMARVFSDEGAGGAGGRAEAETVVLVVRSVLPAEHTAGLVREALRGGL